MKVQLGFTKAQVIHTLKVFVYIAVSGGIAALIAYVTGNPDAVGGIAVAAGINQLLVTLQQFVTAPEK